MLFFCLCNLLPSQQSTSFLIYVFNHSALCAELRESACFLHWGVPPVWHCSGADGIGDNDLQSVRLCVHAKEARGVFCFNVSPHLSTCTRVTLKPIDLTHTCFTQYVPPPGSSSLQRVVVASEIGLCIFHTTPEHHNDITIKLDLHHLCYDSASCFQEAFFLQSKMIHPSHFLSRNYIQECLRQVCFVIAFKEYTII